MHSGTQLWQLKQGFPDLETSNTQNRCKFRTSFGLKTAFGKVGHPRHGASIPQHSFSDSKKKRGQPGTRCHVAVIPGQRQKPPRKTQRPRQAHLRKSRVPSKILSRKDILPPQIIVDAEARQILGGAGGAKSSMCVLDSTARKGSRQAQNEAKGAEKEARAPRNNRIYLFF